LVTGPTGSGKTVTLYSALHRLNTTQVNISTAEDPIEMNLSGMNQVPIQPKTGLTFAQVLRSLLRQDPDILMVGEIRDVDTAEMAIKAAQTGHLVLSTLHTNSAAETLTRLIQMGIAPFQVATSLSLVVAQRLARRLCDYCKIKTIIPDQVLSDLGFLPHHYVSPFICYAAKGCEHCKNGYKGRVGLYEVMPISKTMMQMIMLQAHALDMADQAAKEGIVHLAWAGLLKVQQGITSLEESYRVTHH